MTVRLIGLRLLAAEGEDGSRGCQSLDSGDMLRYGCQKSLDWDSDGELRSEGESPSSPEQFERNVERFARNAMGQDQSVEKISLVLED